MSSTAYVVVVGIDFSEQSNKALDQALEVASIHAGEVHVVYVDQESPLEALVASTMKQTVSGDVAVEQVRQRATERVGVVAEMHGKILVRRVVAHFRRGSPAEEIAQLASDLDADLVVVGSHGRHGAERMLLGSVADRVSRLTRCPVWIVRPKDHQGVRVPAIEPPCPDCVARRAATSGAEMWCARHSEHHNRPHRYSYRSDGMYGADTHAYDATPERGA